MLSFSSQIGVVVVMINTREIAKEYRLTHWAKIMQERRDSGLSIKDYCCQIGICQNTYFYWQRRVRLAACKVLPSKTSELMVRPPNEPALRETGNALAPKGWALAVSAPPPAEENLLPIEIGGCRVMASMETDPQLLSRVCKVLVGLC